MKSLLLATVLLFVATTGSARDTVIQSTADRSVAAQLIFSASPLATMTEIPFRVELSQKDPDIKIRAGVCDLSMPAMPMPENRPVLECSGQQCRGRAIFTMAGAWQVRCDLVLRDGTTISPVFRIDKVTMK